MRHVTEISRWSVALAEGPTIEVWADGYQELDGFYVFGVLADIDEAPGQELLITSHTPDNPARVGVALARFPVTAVTGITGG